MRAMRFPVVDLARIFKIGSILAILYYCFHRGNKEANYIGILYVT